MDSETIKILLSKKFLREHGVIDAKSAYYWLVDKKQLRRTVPTVRFRTDIKQWTAVVDGFSESFSMKAIGMGFAHDKKTAEQQAFLKVLRVLESQLQQRQSHSQSMSSPPCTIFDSPTGEDSAASFQSCLAVKSDYIESENSVKPLANAALPLHTRKQQDQVRIAREEYNRFGAIMRSFNHQSPITLISIDVEKYDAPNSFLILEFGVDIIYADPTEAVKGRSRRHFHYVITDHLAIKNTHVPNHPDCYAHGKSDRVSELDVMRVVSELSKVVSRNNDCILIGHTLRQDITWLERRSREMKQQGKAEEEIRFEGAMTLDIALLDRAVRSDFQSRKLETMGRDYGVKFVGCPHNAGNDAVFTLDTFIAMADKL